MATAPVFASTGKTASALLGAVETSTTVPTTTSTVYTAGANGTIIDRVTVQGVDNNLTATTVAGLVYVFLYDGATYHLFDTIVVQPITASATVQPFSASKSYSRLVLPNGWSLRVSQSVAANASKLKFTAQVMDI